mmetsp:Transcript_18550/g.40275  ORF Transcript_18550/g.40275 Transcript_18550/m.40275 type:complete len:658 (+) Transcript_18550:80-2053(+)
MRRGFFELALAFLLAPCFCAHWREVASTSPWTQRYGFGSVTCGNGVVVVGGLQGGGGAGSALNDVWISRNVGASWERQTSAAAWATRAFMGLLNDQAAVSSHLWLLSGDNLNTRGMVVTAYTNDVWHSADCGVRWTVTTQLAPWHRRGGIQAVRAGSKMLVLGGCGWGTSPSGFGLCLPLNDVWVSHDDGLSWAMVTNHAPWPARYYAGSTDLDGRALIMGGFGPSLSDTHTVTFSDVWVSADGGEKWTELNADAWPAVSPNVLESRGHLLVLGGQPAFGGLDSRLWCSSDGGTTWKSVGSFPGVCLPLSGSVSVPSANNMTNVLVMGGVTDWNKFPSHQWPPPTDFQWSGNDVWSSTDVSSCIPVDAPPKRNNTLLIGLVSGFGAVAIFLCLLLAWCRCRSKARRPIQDLAYRPLDSETGSLNAPYSTMPPRQPKPPSAATPQSRPLPRAYRPPQRPVTREPERPAAAARPISVRCAACGYLKHEVMHLAGCHSMFVLLRDKIHCTGCSFVGDYFEHHCAVCHNVTRINATDPPATPVAHAEVTLSVEFLATANSCCTTTTLQIRRRDAGFRTLAVRCPCGYIKRDVMHLGGCYSMFVVCETPGGGFTVECTEGHSLSTLAFNCALCKRVSKFRFADKTPSKTIEMELWKAVLFDA